MVGQNFTLVLYRYSSDKSILLTSTGKGYVVKKKPDEVFNFGIPHENF